MFRDLSAYTPATPPQSYPPFINIAELDDGSGAVRVTVRSPGIPAAGGPICPCPSVIELPRDVAIELFLSAAFQLTFGSDRNDA